jgi:hypothetical protein
MTGLTGQVHFMAWEEGGVAALVRRCARKRWRSSGASEGGRGRLAGWVGQKGQMGRLATRLVAAEAEKNPFRINIGILNLP